MAKRKSASTLKSVESIVHDSDKRRNIPTAEHQSVIQAADAQVTRIRYPRNVDLDPQLVWRGKDEQDWSDLVVPVPPLYIQEKVNPKALIDELLRATGERRHEAGDRSIDLFSDFDGIPHGADKTEFYRHDQNWSNRMVLGDSLQVMASLAEREGLRGKVQCVYIDPPYGIKFNSNFQWSTADRSGTSNDAVDKITREPEQVRAFRDTWRDGVHSYLSYLRDRLTVSRDLLTPSGSVFVQIGEDNLHLVRSLLDEVFGPANFMSQISFRTASTKPTKYLSGVADFLVWYARDRETIKYRELFLPRADSQPDSFETQPLEASAPQTRYSFEFNGQSYNPPNGWRVSEQTMKRLAKAGRIAVVGKALRYKRYFSDFAYTRLNSLWDDLWGEQRKTFVVQTAVPVIERCVLMTTDPGDLVVDPTCGSGTTAFVSEKWGRRWITIDSSRVALALARTRLCGGRFPSFVLADSPEGQKAIADRDGAAVSTRSTARNIRLGFVYATAPHIERSAIGANSDVDVIWDRYAPRAAALAAKLGVSPDVDVEQCAKQLSAAASVQSGRPADSVEEFIKLVGERQERIADSIRRHAERQILVDSPVERDGYVRVAGPFTVESLSPHRTLVVGAEDELIDPLRTCGEEFAARQSFTQIILENLRSAGVQQSHKADKIAFTSLTPWAGDMVCAEGRYQEGETERRAAIFIGPEFGTVQRADLVDAAKEAGDAGFDVLISCAFNYDAHATEFSKLGRIPVLKARMNADLHMADDLKNTGKGNLFVVFGEPDIELIPDSDGRMRIKVRGVDVFDPSTGEVRSDTTDGIACWFIDTDYNEESFFVRHAYFLGANDPYSALKTTLKAEIDRDAWESLRSDVSRPFPRPKSGRVAVKVINHLGDEVMRVLKV